MNPYHKIHTLFKRDPTTKHKTLLSEFSLPEFEYLRNTHWVFTEMVDGMNIRIMHTGGGTEIRGKTDQSQIPLTLYDKLVAQFGKANSRFVKVFGDEPMCLYGEGYGAKIQKGGGNYRQDQDFVLFDVKIGDVWLQREDVRDIAKKLDIDVVPIVGVGTLDYLKTNVMLGLTSFWGDFQAEGIVARPTVELRTRRGDRVITKLKYRDFAHVESEAKGGSDGS